MNYQILVRGRGGGGGGHFFEGKGGVPGAGGRGAFTLSNILCGDENIVRGGWRHLPITVLFRALCLAGLWERTSGPQNHRWGRWGRPGGLFFLHTGGAT